MLLVTEAMAMGRAGKSADHRSEAYFEIRLINGSTFFSQEEGPFARYFPLLNISIECIIWDFFGRKRAFYNNIVLTFQNWSDHRIYRSSFRFWRNSQGVTDIGNNLKDLTVRNSELVY